MIKYKRKKKKNYLNSFIYKLNKIFLFPNILKFKLYANLEWIFFRLAHEIYHQIEGKNEINLNRVDYLNFLRTKLTKEKTVIDIGCHNGKNTFLTSKYCKNIIGVDHNKEFISKAKDKYKHKSSINFVADDVFKFLKKNKNRFDIAICSHILEHLDNPKVFLKKLKKFVKFIYVEIPDFENNYLNLVKKKYNIYLNYSDDDHIFEFDRQSIKKIFNHNNLKILDQSYRFGVMKFWLKT